MVTLEIEQIIAEKARLFYDATPEEVEFFINILLSSEARLADGDFKPEFANVELEAIGIATIMEVLNDVLFEKKEANKMDEQSAEFLRKITSYFTQNTLYSEGGRYSSLIRNIGEMATAIQQAISHKLLRHPEKMTAEVNIKLTQVNTILFNLISWYGQHLVHRQLQDN